MLGLGVGRLVAIGVVVLLCSGDVLIRRRRARAAATPARPKRKLAETAAAAPVTAARNVGLISSPPSSSTGPRRTRGRFEETPKCACGLYQHSSVSGRLCVPATGGGHLQSARAVASGPRQSRETTSGGFPWRQIERGAIVRPAQLRVEPAHQLSACAKRGHALVLDCREDCASKHDLSSCIALPFGPADASHQTVLLGTQTREPLIQ